MPETSCGLGIRTYTPTSQQPPSHILASLCHHPDPDKSAHDHQDQIPVPEITQQLRKPRCDENSQHPESERTQQDEREHPHQKMTMANLILDCPNDIVPENHQERGRQRGRDLIHMAEDPRPQVELNLTDEIRDDTHIDELTRSMIKGLNP
jgi:hypothetical protein